MSVLHLVSRWFFFTSRRRRTRFDCDWSSDVCSSDLQSTSAPAATAAAAGTVANAFINRAFPGFNFLVGSESQPSAILDALHTVTGVKVLSKDRKSVV